MQHGTTMKIPLNVS